MATGQPHHVDAFGQARPGAYAAAGQKRRLIEMPNRLGRGA